MSFRSLFLIPGILALALAPLPLSAQDDAPQGLGGPEFGEVAAKTSGKLEGDVRGVDGKPLTGVNVALDRTDVRAHFDVKTDKKGHYSRNVPAGKYDVLLDAGGISKKVTAVTIAVGENKPVDIDLQAVKAEADKAIKDKAALAERNKKLLDLFGQAKIAMDAKNCSGAIELLNQIKEMDARQSAVWTNLGDCYSTMARESKTDSAANYEKAVDSYKKSLEIKEDALVFNNYALVLSAIKKNDEAKAAMAKAVALDPPGAGRYYFNLGVPMLNAGQLDDAAEQFRKAIEANPKYAAAQFQLGMTLVNKATVDASGKMLAPPGTVEAFQAYLSLEPAGAEAADAKAMLTALGSTVSTTYKNPDAPAAPKGNTKKK